MRLILFYCVLNSVVLPSKGNREIWGRDWGNFSKGPWRWILVIQLVFRSCRLLSWQVFSLCSLVCSNKHWKLHVCFPPTGCFSACSVFVAWLLAEVFLWLTRWLLIQSCSATELQHCGVCFRPFKEILKWETRISGKVDDGKQTNKQPSTKTAVFQVWGNVATKVNEV